MREAIALVKRARVEEIITHARHALMAFGISDPCIAVAGLSPHAGEHGLFGNEETSEIVPAIAAAQSEVWRVLEPVLFI